MPYISKTNNVYNNFQQLYTINTNNSGLENVEKQKKNIVSKPKNFINMMNYSSFSKSCNSSNNNEENPPLDLKHINRKEKVLEVCVDDYGFFRTTDDDKRLYVTHDDTFHLDKKNNLVTSRGYYIEGYDAGKLSSNETPKAINFSKHMTIPGKTTNLISINTELNSNTDIKPFSKFDMHKNNSYNAVIPVFGYDIDGKKYEIKIFCIKRSPHKWELYPSFSNHRIFNKSFNIEFNEEGNIISKPIYKNIAFHKLGYPDTQNMIIDLRELRSKRMKSSNMNAKIKFLQNGKESYDLKDLEVNHSGMIYGIYTNNKKIPLKQLILIRLKNIKKIEYRGGFFWEIPKDKISPNNQEVSIPGSPRFGKILNKNSKEYEAYHESQLQIGREMRKQQEYGI
ncbi:hypothetical protein RJV14_01270 [Buchnera aphidicola (Kurisakia onigurumii)]|uniref:flagellar basal body FlgE domain-containing protein n=1 Tax=Buchnera aphidicola TaxID=9 RepID=UPI0031B681E7